MKFKTFIGSSQNSLKVIDDLKSNVEDFDLLMLYGTEGYDWSSFGTKLMDHYGCEAKIIGASSCLGLLGNQGFHSSEGQAFGAVAISQFPGDIGIAAVFEEPSKENIPKACLEMLKNADRVGELPDFVWILSSPGTEEYVLHEIHEYFNSKINMFGGTCADNTINGNWKLLKQTQTSAIGFVIVAFFSETEQIVASFNSGYTPTNKTAVVTGSQKREIISLDNQSAFEYFNNWLEHKMDDKSEENRPINILADTTMTPLGRIKGEINGVSYYLLSHPETVQPNKSITLFTDIQENDVVTLMEGNLNTLQNRLAEVVDSLMRRERLSKEDLSGALIVYCAGCMLAVNEHGLMNNVVTELKKIIGETPFLGIHTFGEQGKFFTEGECHHGNLMISATLFLK